MQNSGHLKVRGYLRSCWDHDIVSSLLESLLSRPDHSAYTTSEPTQTYTNKTHGDNFYISTKSKRCIMGQCWVLRFVITGNTSVCHNVCTVVKIWVDIEVFCYIILVYFYIIYVSCCEEHKILEYSRLQLSGCSTSKTTCWPVVKLL